MEQLCETWDVEA